MRVQRHVKEGCKFLKNKGEGELRAIQLKPKYHFRELEMQVIQTLAFQVSAEFT